MLVTPVAEAVATRVDGKGTRSASWKPGQLQDKLKNTPRG